VAEASKVIELFEFSTFQSLVGLKGGGAVITTTMMIMAPPAIMMVALRA
jgi:hypothetical protein